MHGHFLSAMLAALFSQRAREAQVEIAARGVFFAMRTTTVVRIDPCAVTLTAEEIRLRQYG